MGIILFVDQPTRLAASGKVIYLDIPVRSVYGFGKCKQCAFASSPPYNNKMT